MIGVQRRLTDAMAFDADRVYCRRYPERAPICLRSAKESGIDSRRGQLAFRLTF